MPKLVHALITDEAGQDLAEYGIALGVITLAVVAAVLALAPQVQQLWDDAQTKIASVGN
jgi:Flp pilus assembly pilin Flp